METDQTILTIEKHFNLYDLVKNHGYLPNGSAAAVIELDLISQSLGHRKTDLYCPACVKDLFLRMFEHYLPILKKSIEVVDETFISDVASKPKRGRPFKNKA